MPGEQVHHIIANETWELPLITKVRVKDQTGASQEYMLWNSADY